MRADGTGHLVPLPGGGFSVWKWVCLRGAGFPAELTLDLVATATAAAADRLIGAEAETEELRRAYETTARSEGAEVRGRLQRRFAERDIELALRWQSPGALDGSIAWLLRQPVDRWNRRVRESERLAGRFLQRYALKNDSIGFFGPIGWADLDVTAPATSVEVGPSLTSKQFVRLEAWGVDALLDAVEHDPAVEISLVPWRLPGAYLDGDRALFPARVEWARRTGLDPGVGAVDLDPALRHLLELCDGRRTAGEISRQIAGSPAGGGDETETLQRLGWLRSRALIGFRLEVPLTLHPDRALRALVATIKDTAARRRLQERVEPVLAAFDGVALATSPDTLAAALGELDSAFAAVTARSPRRAEGRTYAGRTLVHIDAVRDVRARIGPEVIAALGPPLSLVLASARWFTHTIAQGMSRAFRELHHGLAQKSGDAPTLVAFSRVALPVVVDDARCIAATTAVEFQRRWAEILRPDPAARVIQRTASELAPEVAETFAAPHPGWQLARYVSPDVLIEAENARAIAEGHFGLVLGEVHLDNTLSRNLFLEAHPDPGALYRARDLDIAGTCVLPVPSKRFNVPRTAVGLCSPRDHWFVYEDAPTGLPPERTVTLGELVVDDEDRGLVVRTRDRRFSTPVIEFFSHTIANANMSLPGLLADAPHTPRVVVDRLAVHRETWNLAAAEISPAPRSGNAGPDRDERFLAARRLRRARGMPRQIFVRAGEERPFCVNFDSPILIDVLGHFAARLSPEAPVRCSEFIPGFGGHWLADHDGRGYTSELRLVALDPLSPV